MSQDANAKVVKISLRGAEHLTLLAWQLSCLLRGKTSTDVTHQLLNLQ